MADNNLRETLRSLIENERLSESEQTHVQAMLSPPKRRCQRHWIIAATFAASLVVALTLWMADVPGTKNEALWRVAEEVTINHTRIKPLDVTSSSFERIRASLPLLDFSPQYPALPQIKGLELIGGRYCTLQGVIATQLVFRDEYGNRITLYQSAYDPTRFGAIPDANRQQPPAMLIQQGLEILIWQQSGVLLALASTAG